jgi:hypothetical protein
MAEQNVNLANSKNKKSEATKPDVKKVVKDSVVTETLDTRLLRWASTNGLKKSPAVLMLVSAVKETRNIEFWGSFNMLDVLPHAKFTGTSRQETLVKFYVTLRNVLVFVPVALTWAAISVATSAFGTFTAQNQATTVNFLSFWQDGYGYLSDFWHIDSVAQFDVFVVLMVIGLTLLIGRLSSVNDLAYEEGWDRAEEQRIAIAMELQNFFHSRREITDKTVSETVAESVSGLRDMSLSMSKAMTELQKVMSGILDETLPRVDTLGQTLASLGELSTRRITDLVDTLSTGITSASMVINSMGKTMHDLGNDAKQAADRIVGVEKSISSASDELKDTVIKFGASASETKQNLDSGLANAIDKATISIDNIMNEMSVTSSSLKSSARTVQDQLEELQRSLQRKIKINRD